MSKTCVNCRLIKIGEHGNPSLPIACNHPDYESGPHQQIGQTWRPQWDERNCLDKNNWAKWALGKDHNIHIARKEA